MQDMGIEVLFQGSNFIRLLEGLWVTIRISIFSVVVSIFLGIILGMIMTVKNPLLRIITRSYLEFVRIMPQLVLLFLVYFGLTKMFRINLSGEISAIIVFVIWGTAEMGDLVRGSLTSIPVHQYESGKALGLTTVQNYIYVIIPQTIRRLLGPRKAQKREKKEVIKEAEGLLQRVGLLDKKDAYPRQLSGGQKQRVAIVRALCMHPKIMLFDEVTAALDPEMVREVLDVMLKLAKDGTTMVIVTHEMQFAKAVADRIVFLDNGTIVEESEPHTFFTNPSTDRAKQFLNLFEFEAI